MTSSATASVRTFSTPLSLRSSNHERAVPGPLLVPGTALPQSVFRAVIYSLLDTASHWAARVTRVVVVVMAAICMASLIFQVFTRYFLGSASSWTEELALLLFTWIVLLAGSLGVREGFHVRLTLVLDALPKPARIWVERLIILLVLVFGAMLLVSGLDYVTRTLGQVSAAVRYPIQTLTSAAPVAGALIVLHALPRLIQPDTTPSQPAGEV
jgi:TRAP-type C4-dicarboxylate transport system permease small subunit